MIKRLFRLMGMTLMLAGFAPALAADAGSEEAESSAAVSTTGHGDHTQTAKDLQNPLSSLILLPFQNITNHGFDPGGGVQNTLNIQPVIPIPMTPRWKVLMRPIVPVVANSWPEDEFGLGDVQFEPFFAPARKDSFTWGAGPVLSFPTATEDAIGTGKYTAGPAFAMFGHKGRWTCSMIITQQWSFAGDSDRDDVSLFNLQPSVNYNLDKGWYLIVGPLISADWEAESGQQWIVPLGGGAGKIMNVGSRKMSVSLETYWNIEHPDEGPDAMTILTVTMIFRE